MATSQVSVVNLALTKLGQDRAVSIDDDVEAVRVMRSLWDDTRDAVLARFPWKFAIFRDSLPSLAAVPVGTQWSVQFQLPEYALRLVQVQEDWIFYAADQLPFVIEGSTSGQVILCNEVSPLFVRYVKRVTNVGLWPPLFARAVAMQLAADACEKLTQSSTKFQDAMAAYELAVREAKRQNGIELPPQRVQDGSWVGARGD